MAKEQNLKSISPTKMNTLPDLRFLLVDDNEIDLFYHEKLIRYQKISSDVVACTNASDALEYLHVLLQNDEVVPPIVILLDIQMPEMNGFDFIRDFEAFPTKIKSLCHVIMLSSSLDFGDITRSKANSLIVKLLRKPLNADELKKILQHIFSR